MENVWIGRMSHVYNTIHYRSTVGGGVWLGTNRGGTSGKMKQGARQKARPPQRMRKKNGTGYQEWDYEDQQWFVTVSGDSFRVDTVWGKVAYLVRLFDQGNLDGGAVRGWTAYNVWDVLTWLEGVVIAMEAVLRECLTSGRRAQWHKKERNQSTWIKVLHVHQDVERCGLRAVLCADDIVKLHPDGEHNLWVCDRLEPSVGVMLGNFTQVSLDNCSTLSLLMYPVSLLSLLLATATLSTPIPVFPLTVFIPYSTYCTETSSVHTDSTHSSYSPVLWLQLRHYHCSHHYTPHQIDLLLGHSYPVPEFYL